MQIIDWILIFFLSTAVLAAVRRLRKKKSCSCGCENCSGCGSRH